MLKSLISMLWEVHRGTRTHLFATCVWETASDLVLEVATATLNATRSSHHIKRTHWASDCNMTPISTGPTFRKIHSRQLPPPSVACMNIHRGNALQLMPPGEDEAFQPPLPLRNIMLVTRRIEIVQRRGHVALLCFLPIMGEHELKRQSSEMLQYKHELHVF